jgi:hypothetical protein
MGILSGIVGAVAGGIKLVKKVIAVKKAASSAVIASASSGALVPVTSNLPSLTSGLGLPALGAVAAGGAAVAAGGLPVPWWKGPGGKLQLPWNDPRIPEYLKSFALDDAYLKIYYRAPRGYVIVRDANGRPFAVNKVIARQFGIWRAAAKPPITATDWKNYKRSKTIEKKLLKIAGPAYRAKQRRAPSKTKSSSRR